MLCASSLTARRAEEVSELRFQSSQVLKIAFPNRGDIPAERAEPRFGLGVPSHVPRELRQP